MLVWISFADADASVTSWARDLLQSSSGPALLVWDDQLGTTVDGGRVRDVQLVNALVIWALLPLNNRSQHRISSDAALGDLHMHATVARGMLSGVLGIKRNAKIVRAAHPRSLGDKSTWKDI